MDTPYLLALLLCAAGGIMVGLDRTKRLRVEHRRRVLRQMRMALDVPDEARW